MMATNNVLDAPSYQICSHSAVRPSRSKAAEGDAGDHYECGVTWGDWG
jgi:hypothetical protein